MTLHSLLKLVAFSMDGQDNLDVLTVLIYSLLLGNAEDQQLVVRI